VVGRKIGLERVNTTEKGSAKMKKSRAEPTKLWRKHSLGVLALKRP